MALKHAVILYGRACLIGAILWLVATIVTMPVSKVTQRLGRLEPFLEMSNGSCARRSCEICRSRHGWRRKRTSSFP